jgi:rubrerythrin
MKLWGGILERLKACIAVENTISEIYTLLAARFPEERDLWRRLALEEENHARMLIMCRGFERRGDLPETISASIEVINHTLDFVRRVRDRVASGRITLREALETAQAIELTSVESCLSGVMSKIDDRNVRSVIGTLLHEGRSHAQMLKEAMIRHGFSGGG